MIFFTKRYRMEPYIFDRMEWWDNLNLDGLGQAVVGFRGDEIFLTFDIRDDKGDVYPVFSPYCRVGAKEGHRLEAYQHYRKMVGVMDGYEIRPLDVCSYRMKDDISKRLKFRIND
jgi:hypothetical protein